MPEPVRLSVSEVRREIYSASGFAVGDGQPSTGLLGIVSRLARRAGPGALNDHERLREHAYDNIIGPKLRENQASLLLVAAGEGAILAEWSGPGR